jgi:hypothetical protein
LLLIFFNSINSLINSLNSKVWRGPTNECCIPFCRTQSSTLIHYSLSVFWIGVASRRSGISGSDRKACRRGAQCRASNRITTKANSAIHYHAVHEEHSRELLTIRYFNCRVVGVKSLFGTIPRCYKIMDHLVK